MSENLGRRVCTKCETPLGLEMKFCRNCGAPVQGSHPEAVGVKTSEVEEVSGQEQVLAQSSGPTDGGSNHRVAPEMSAPLPKTAPVPRMVSNGQSSAYTSNISTPTGTGPVS